MSHQPNILFITSDQQRHDACAPFAPPFLRLPHTERLCHEGVSFTQAYAQSPSCLPSRRSLMLGRSSFSRTEGNLITQPGITNPGETLPGCLGRLGYHTALIGKLHVGQARVRFGFDEVVTADAYYRMMSRSGHSLQPMRHGLGQCEFHPTLATVPEAMTLTSWTAEQSVEFIRHRRDPSQPFFLWTSFHKPHPPLDPPEPYYSMYASQKFPEPARGDWCGGDGCPPMLKRQRVKQCYDKMPDEINPAIKAAYYGLVTQIDYNMGRIFEALVDERLWDNTLILYTSDHGEMLGDHGFYGKAIAHEGSSHIPFILRLPPVWKEDVAGTWNNTLVTHCDVLPTLVSAAGSETPSWSDGMDILSLLRGHVEEPRSSLEGFMNERCFWNPDYKQPDYLYRLEDGWKYIWYPEGGVEQLFRVAEDPNELSDLAQDERYHSLLRQMHSDLLASQIRLGTSAVREGELVHVPIEAMDERALRASMWAGYHGEASPGDILH